MRFGVEHEFPGAPRAVAEVLTDPTFHTSLDLPDLSRPEVAQAAVTDTERMLKLRYEFVGQLDPVARRLLAGRRLMWIQTLVLDTATGIGRLVFAAEAEPSRLYGRADVVLEALDGARTGRRIAGDLFVKLPLVGGNAERRIVPGLVSRLDVEAAAVSAALAATGESR